ncbi:MAG: phosphonate transporter permease [Candidatus Eremiobacteraeota bacterium]|jgi:phosphonate transport system permease protein|nr:phosphonate transporter permease [Candidatus Eremiobacteraeota bacterium]
MTAAQLVDFFREPLLETIGITAGALFIAIVVGAPLGVAIAAGGPLGRFVAAVAGLVRAIPDLVLAIVFVAAIGFGPAAGTLALGLQNAAVGAKLFAELLLSVRREPADALRASGATPVAAFLVGLLPTAYPAIVSFAAYLADCVIRNSVIVGVVGGGGLGAAIMQALNLADFHAFALYFAGIALLVVLFDAYGQWLRTRAPAWAAAATLLLTGIVGAGAFAALSSTPFARFAQAPGRIVHFVVRAFPPQFDATVLHAALVGAGETLAVAAIGTIGGALLAIPVAWLTARPIASGWMRGSGWRPWSAVPELIARLGLSGLRSIPYVAMGLLAVLLVGLGPRAGAFALIAITAASLGRLLAETLDVGPFAPAEALVAGGATATAGALVGIVPDALPMFATHVLYRWEYNIRASTILGMVGAGGLGQRIFNAQELLFYHQLLAYVIVAVVLVLASDAVGEQLRRRLVVDAAMRA